MSYQINLSDQEYAALAEAAARSGIEPEQFLHEMLLRLPSAMQKKRPVTVYELSRRQYQEGKLSHLPNRQPITPEERTAREQRAQRFAGGKPASEMVIEDRGPY